jgi:hypothetical protein
MRTAMIMSAFIMLFAGCGDSNYRDPEIAEFYHKQALEKAKYEDWLSEKEAEREKYVQDDEMIDERSKIAVAKQQIYVDMPFEDAKVSWNTYRWELGSRNSYGYETWLLYSCYGFEYFSFTNDYLIRCSDSAKWTLVFMNKKLKSWTEWGF